MNFKIPAVIISLLLIPQISFSRIANFNTTEGTFSIKFFTNEAPETSRKIYNLVKNKFYDGVSFHRVIKDFVAQAGDPTGTGMGGSGLKVNFEKNKLKHKFGMVGLARTGNNLDSGDSQFYLCLNTLPHLDGNHVIFAQVIKGMEVLRKIKKGTKIKSTSIGGEEN